MILAMASLAYKDLAEWLIDNDKQQAKKLNVILTNQTWATSKFTAPTNMLFRNQKDNVTIDFSGVNAYQVEDQKKLAMINQTLAHHYYALDGGIFYIKHASGTTSGTNLNISYYKIPANSDIDDQLRNKFLELLIQRLTVRLPRNGQN